MSESTAATMDLAPMDRLIDLELPSTQEALEASDQWFEANHIQTRERDQDSDVQVVAGSVTILTKLMDKIADFNLDTSGWGTFGVSRLVNAYRTKLEARFTTTESAQEAIEESGKNVLASFASGFSAGFVTALTVTPSVLAIPWGILVGLVRGGAALSTHEQIKLHAGVENESPESKETSDQWLQSKNVRELPLLMRNLEYSYHKIMAPGSIILGVIIGFSSFGTGLLVALPSVYHYWKYKKVLPPVLKWYEDLSESTQQAVS